MGKNMSESVGTLYLKVEVDDKGVDDGLSRIQGKVEKSGGFLSNALSFATGGAILGGLQAIGGSILGVAKSMIDGNAEFEKYQTQFGVLLGSADAAKQRLAELAKFGANTPFELPELVQADKVLTGFGIHSEELLTIVGDVASGTGASFQDMALLMGKFSAGATGEAISRFQELGITTRDELAKMGIEFTAAGQMTTPVAEAMPILEQIMKDKFGGMMAAQSQTFEGITNNLQDWVGNTIRTLGQPIFEVVKDKLSALLTFLSSPEVQAGLTAFAQLLATGIGNAIGFITNTVIPAFTAAWRTLSPIVSALLPVLSNLSGSFSTSGGIISSVVTSIQTIITTIFTAIRSFIQAHGDEIASFMRNTWTTISEIIRIALDIINATIVPMLQYLAGFIQAHGTEIQAIFDGVWKVITSIINIALGVIKGVLQTALALIKGDWSGAWEAIKTMFNTVWENLKTILKVALDFIINLLSLGWKTIGDNMRKAWDGVLTLFKIILGELRDVVAEQVNGAINFLTGLAGRWRSAGSALIDNFFDGLKSKASAILDWARGIAQQVSDILPGSEPRDPTSPLRGLGKRGEALVTNFQVGLEKRTPGLLEAINKAVTPTPMTNSMNATQPVTNNFYLSYATQQSTGSVQNDVQLLQAMYS